ncbi:MAG: PAS domain S-box protein [Acidobacteria bacterium]|nr:PAS domain S-box protein [Acidobacteriota bacterium]MCB9399295.1 PAS domain S-box protein [Acidobacteriota bacterium]
MVQFNTKDNEILVKIVFYGPGLSGKTTNLQKLHEMMDPSQKTDLFSVNTMEDRTLFFDLLPVDLGYIYGNSIKLQIYTVPGQVHYDSTRRIVLSGADGVIFIADSDKNKLHENVQSINNLYHNLQANRLNIKEVPLVMQYNKRDLPDALPVEILNQKLNFRQVPHFGAVAIKGDGVLDTFVEAVKMTVRYIFEKYQLSKNFKNVEGVIQKLEESIREKSAESKRLAENPPQMDVDQTFSPRVGRGGKTVLKYTHTIDDDDRSSQDKLLQKALTSNMETARLYAELKASQAALMKKNEELSILYKQLEKSNNDNLKIRRFLESLVNFAGEAIVTFNDLWVIQNWNQAAEEMFKYKRDEILNQNINILFPQSQLADLNKVLSFVVSGKVVKGFETRLQDKEGNALAVNVTFSPIKNKNETIIAFTAIIRDLSLLSNVRKKLFSLQRFESLAHLLPGFLQAVKAHMEGGGDVEAMLGEKKKANKSEKQIKRGIATLQTMMDTKSEAKPVQINEVIQDIQSLVEETTQSLGIQLVSQLNAELPVAKISRKLITHTLLNLVFNALDALNGHASPKLTIGTHFLDGEYIIQIIDNGSGSAIMDMDKFFSTMEENETEGTNILRINTARELAKEFGGVLRVDTAPGKGTKVTLRMPQAT